MFDWQVLWQAGHLSQKLPERLESLHTHLPQTHLPWPLHTKLSGDWQVDVEAGHSQLSPVHSFLHTHSPNTHSPWPREIVVKSIWRKSTLNVNLYRSTTSTQQSPEVRTREVVFLTVFSVDCPQPALLTHTPPAFTNSSSAADHVRPFSLASEAWIPLLLVCTFVTLGLAAAMAVSSWSTTAATFGVDPNHSGLIVTHWANCHCYMLIFAISRTGTHTNSDIKVNLYQQEIGHW